MNSRSNSMRVRGKGREDPKVPRFEGSKVVQSSVIYLREVEFGLRIRERPNGADRHSAHSGTTQQGAQQPAATENLRETNVELREENPKTSPENLINTFCGAP